MARLIIQLLGPLIVTKDDHPIVFSYDKVRALLAYLAVETSGPVSRGRLAGLLWPDQPQTAAQDSLRQALSRLRGLIGDRDARLPFLLVDRDTVQINPAASLQIDLATFLEILAQVNHHHHRALAACPTCEALLEKADSLVRGDFLEDLSLPESDLFETWATTKREQIKIQVMLLYSRLAHYFERWGDLERSMAYASRQILIDPYHEPAHRQMMQTLVRSGQRSQAVLHFSHLKEMLANDLSVQPAVETLELFEAIRLGYPLPDPYTERARNLPVPVTPLVGREVELSELSAWLTDPDRRLISVMGPGGVGKTRLVIQVARQVASMFSDGVLYVPLSQSSGAAAPSLGESIAQTLGIPIEDAWMQVTGALRNQEILLVLDRFEHVLAERGQVAELLETNARVVVLTTTRQRLELPGEWIFGLGGLAIPPIQMNLQLEAYSSAALFCQCASQVNPAFELNSANRASIGEICRQVGGLPLAIRLAAAWTRSMSCKEIADEIRSGLDILSSQLSSEPEVDQNSVRAVFEQSWNRLELADKEVFARMSVFRGGFDRPAAEQVAGATLTTLTRLVDQSLLMMETEGRYDLHDLLNQFGTEKLQQSNGEVAVRQRHFEYYYAQAEQNERQLNGKEPLYAFIWLIREAANLRLALFWAQAHAPEQANMLTHWMHPEFHQMGMHVFVQQRQQRTSS